MIENELLSMDNGIDKEVLADATDVAKEYYTSYAKYVLEYRALPSIYDGLKPVQRRIIYTANQYPQKLMKTAKLSGAVLAYHPHGSASITGAINDMAHPLNALPLFKTKGNFGGVNCSASADRYTECYLSEIARKNFCQFIDYAEYEVGEIGEMEPVALPSLIPYCLFKGSEGIGVGLSTKIMPLNLIDLIDYYIDYIKNDGSSKKFIKPDVGYVLLEMDKSWINQAVHEYKGKITVSSVITQISNNSLLVEGLYSISIDAVINKINKWYGWFDKDQVGFRDSSTTTMKYVFEIYDDTNVSIKDLKEALVYATRRSGTYTRVVEQDSNAVYSSLDYVVKNSLECLNKAIDNKISSELKNYQNQLELYTVLDLCKKSNVFDGITTMTSDQLIDLIMRTTSCTYELAKEVTKKPISYLTTSHDNEIDYINDKISELNNHDRKKFLIKLYKDFRKLVLPIYEDKKHSLTEDMMLTDPRIKLSDDGVEVTEGDGEEFDSTVYFVSDAGYIYKRSISTTAASSVIVDTSAGDNLIGLATDKCKYLKIITKFNYDKWYGVSLISIDDISYDKKYVNLREDEGEHIVSVEGINKIPKNYKSALKGSRVSKTTYFKE